MKNQCRLGYRLGLTCGIKYDDVIWILFRKSDVMRVYSLIHQHFVLFPCRETALRLRATDSF